MAAFSLGKLDAICARLKSTQQSQTASPVRDQAKKVAVKPNEDWGQNGTSTESRLDSPPRAPHPNGCSENVAREKIKTATESTPPSSSENHTVSINPKNNNNNVEATDYNEIASSSPACSTFQTADSTTADTLVSSTTGDNSLTNHGGTWDTFISNLTVQQPESLSPPAAKGSNSNIDPQGSSAADKGQPSGCESNCTEADNSASNHDVTSSSTYTLTSLKTVDTPPSNDTQLSARNTVADITDSNALDNENSARGDTPIQKTEPNCTSTEAEPVNKVNCIPEPPLYSNEDLVHHSDILTHSFSCLPSSGRRKSRKAAKPQKQAKDDFYLEQLDAELEMDTPDKSNNLCDKGLVLTGTFDSENRVGGFSKEDVLIPLHPSSAVDNIFVQKKSASEIDHSASDNIACHNADEAITNEIEQKDVTHEISKTTCSPLDLTDSKGLVDYAQNTMKELLGIYGFEGSESRNLVFQSLQNLPEEKSTFPVALETVYAQNKETVLKDSMDHSDESGSDNTESSGKKISSLNPPLCKDSANINGSSSRKMLPELFTSMKSLSGKKKPYIHKAINSAEFSKLIKRYGTGTECGGKLCHDLGYRDHYHCLDCPHKVFIRKEEMLRHYKWHKKRQDSLQHGFMRYSPTDDCSKKYGNCAHNGRQTHYHCVQDGCDKVYVSTSDVQMHANFHRKDSAIIQEGFQRFRATEDCGTLACAFHGQRTTHFHCRRPQCHFTFKNKADMEKHKSYHQKDEMLSRDGFKKFMKYEVCQYSNCRYSKTSNHIHCIRPGCQYVLHSSTQLYSHKRKHERRDFEFAYRNYRHLQQQQSPKSNLKSKKTDLNTLSEKMKPAVVESDVKISSPVMATLPVQPFLVSIPSPSVEADTALNLSSQRAESPMKETEVPVDLPINLAPDREQPATLNREQPTALNREQPVTLNREQPATLNREQPATLNREQPTMLNREQPATLKREQPGQCVKMEVDAELEPQDLSVKSRLPDFLEMSFDANGYQIEPIPLCKKEVKEEETRRESGYVCDNDEGVDDEEDDDDDDDDDKDYGLYEEPILVNTIGVEQTNMSLNAVQIKDEALTVKTEERQPCENDGSSSLCPDNLVPACKKEIISATSQEALADPNILMRANKSQALALAHKLTPSERKERDESWKKYLTRYTANDACYSRCSCLYKDHYHCRVEGCQVIFKSKDGVRGHARFHDVQDNLTPLVFRYFSAGAACHVANCQFERKESHYHCNWTNCTHAISSSAPTFARLEHYRIHDYATTYVGKCRNTLFGGNKVELDPLHKRRGRPPKYPKYDLPMVPKVHLTEKEITDSTIAFMHNRCPENSRIINGFKKFVSPELCPDDKCLYRGKEHYHCGRKFCHMSTDRLDVLNVHAKEFHNNITILEGYEFFERMVNCRRPVCHNNRINRHFHCVRSRCDYSFVRHSTMAQHNKKHPTVTSAVLSTPITRAAPISSMASAKSTSSSYVPIAPAVTSPLASPPPPVLLKPMPSSYKNTIKSSGTYYPVPGLSKFKLTPVPTSRANTKTSRVKTDQAIANPSAHTGVNSIFSQNGVCLTLSPISLLTQTPFVQQTNVLTGIIPVGQLAQQSLTSQLVNISGNQFLTNTQGKYLPHSELIGSKVLQLVQSTPSTTCSPSTASSVHLTNQISPVLLQTKHEVPCNWPNLKKSMYFSVQLSCGRPFCKLKKKDHYHCLDCNQAFSDPARLRTHLSKHGFKFQKSVGKNNTATNPRVPKALGLNMAYRLDKEKEILSDAEDAEDLVNSSLNLQPSVFANMVAAPLKNESVALTPALNGNREPVGDSDKEKTCLIGNDSSFLDTSSLSIDEESSESSLNVSSSSLTLCSSLSSRQSGSKRSLEPEAETPEPKRKCNGKESQLGEIPGGYKRVRCGEDCGHIRCAYRQTVTHYHCTRDNCGYGFSDKLRIWQHRVRHERLDALMGNEFQQFRASVSCARPDCEFNVRASHFHCLKCLYSCSDSSKVPAHRKYHAKLDKISSNGFLKYSGTSDCQTASCSYFRKQTHYHCTFFGCKHAVLGPSQMAAHKQKHVLGQSILQ